MAEKKGALVPKSDVDLQARQTISPLPGRIGNVESWFRPPAPFTAGILNALSTLVLSIARWIDVSSERSSGQSLERRGNCGRGRGQRKGRCFRN